MRHTGAWAELVRACFFLGVPSKRILLFFFPLKAAVEILDSWRQASGQYFMYYCQRFRKCLGLKLPEGETPRVASVFHVTSTS